MALPVTVRVDVATGVPVQVGLSTYRKKVSVPVGLKPPDRVALSTIPPLFRLAVVERLGAAWLTTTVSLGSPQAPATLSLPAVSA